jgi:F-type H+-transporting ATPase subunit delta
MASTAFGKRYAQAAFELAIQRHELESWKEGLSRIADIGKDSKQLAVFENPKVPFNVKRGLLEERLGRVSPLALNLACLLLTKGRLRIAGDILQEYCRLLDAYHGIEHADIVTALPLDEEDKERISTQLGDLVGRKVVIDARTDPTMVGGFRAKIGDRLIDGSTRSRLESLRRTLVQVGIEY